MHIQIVTPHGRIFDAPGMGVRVESAMGQIEVLPDHEPIIAALDIGAAVVKGGENDLHFALNHGYVEVLNNRIEIVVETAEQATDIDVQRAEASKAKAEEKLQELDQSQDTERIAQVNEDLRLAEVRIAVGSQHG